MAGEQKRELRLVEYSFDNYIENMKNLAFKGYKKFYVLGEKKHAEELIAKSAELNMSDISILFSDQESFGDKSDIDAAFIITEDADELSSILIKFANYSDLIIVAPISDHYCNKRPLLIQSIPKSGTHMMFECAKAFGYCQPESVQLPNYNSELKPGFFYNLQHMSMDYLALQYQTIGRFVNDFCNSVVVFIYRDPRDIALSMAHYLTSKDDYHILSRYMRSLTVEQRISTVIQGTYPVPVYINDHLFFKGSIRDLCLLYSNWIKEPFENTISVRYEDLVGKKGDSDEFAQLNSIWKLQLALHVPGKPQDFADKIYNNNTETFRSGKIGGYSLEFKPEHYELLNNLPQDFMEIYGYDNKIIHNDFCFFSRLFKGSIPFKTQIPLLVEEDYRNYNIVLLSGEYYALSQCLGELNLENIEKAELDKYKSAGNCFSSKNTTDLKLLIDKALKDNDPAIDFNDRDLPLECKNIDPDSQCFVENHCQQKDDHMEKLFDQLRDKENITGNMREEIRILNQDNAQLQDKLRDKHAVIEELGRKQESLVKRCEELEAEAKKVGPLVEMQESLVERCEELEAEAKKIESLREMIEKRDKEINILKAREKELVQWIDFIHQRLVKVK